MTNKFPIKSHAYICNICKTSTNNKKDYNKHLLTLKHKTRTSLTTIEPINPIVFKNDNAHCCKRCNKKYKARNSLWYHEKKCKFQKINLEITDEKNVNDDGSDNDLEADSELNQNIVIPPGSDMKVLTSLVLELVKSNTDLQKQVIDLCKNNNITNNTNTINSHNKTFNLQVFLNEECKDAMNLSEFIKSIVVET
jgi:hypothetical protein